MCQFSQNPTMHSMYVHLRLHTEFSVVDGTTRIDELAKAAAADGQLIDTGGTVNDGKLCVKAKVNVHTVHCRILRKLTHVHSPLLKCKKCVLRSAVLVWCAVHQPGFFLEVNHDPPNYVSLIRFQ